MYRMTEKVICPICKSEAEAINVGLFDGVGVRCKTHGEFEVADSALAMHKDTEATRWEAALRLRWSSSRANCLMATASAPSRSGASTEPRYSPLMRMMMMTASLAGWPTFGDGYAWTRRQDNGRTARRRVSASARANNDNPKSLGPPSGECRAAPLS
jgi:hypothetical protein